MEGNQGKLCIFHYLYSDSADECVCEKNTDYEMIQVSGIHRYK